MSKSIINAPQPAVNLGDSSHALAVPRLALRLDDVAAALGVSRRSLERARSAGRFPRPDAHIGKLPLWKPETIKEWIAKGGCA